MEDNSNDYLSAYRQFFEDFASKVKVDDPIPVTTRYQELEEFEINGQVFDWCQRYLNARNCPHTLIVPLSRTVLDEIHLVYKEDPQWGYCSKKKTYGTLQFSQMVIKKLIEVCLRYSDNAVLCSLPAPSQDYLEVSHHGRKNVRSHMEDMHIIVHDLHALYNIQGYGQAGFYAVYDGHQGVRAPQYCVAHLHQYLVESKHYLTDPVAAFKEAFQKTDSAFLSKRMKGGTTAVCALYRQDLKNLYVAWVGDSQAFLCTRKGFFPLVIPHKPELPEERDRIVKAGGSVMLYRHVWRVGGGLAVSRAIGDESYKKYVTSEPDVKVVPITGQEDFVVLGSDGLWDFITLEDVPRSVYSGIQQYKDDWGSYVGEQLCQLATDNGSYDNISALVVLLKARSLIMDMGSPALEKPYPEDVWNRFYEQEPRADPLAPPVESQEDVADESESEDEWDYVRGPKPEVKAVSAQDMESQLNPNAAEFIPGITPLESEEIISSDFKASFQPVEEVVSFDDFMEGISKRPSDLDGSNIFEDKKEEEESNKEKEVCEEGSSEVSSATNVLTNGHNEEHDEEEEDDKENTNPFVANENVNDVLSSPSPVEFVPDHFGKSESGLKSFATDLAEDTNSNSAKGPSNVDSNLKSHFDYVVSHLGSEGDAFSTEDFVTKEKTSHLEYSEVNFDDIIRSKTNFEENHSDTSAFNVNSFNSNEIQKNEFSSNIDNTEGITYENKDIFSASNDVNVFNNYSENNLGKCDKVGSNPFEDSFFKESDEKDTIVESNFLQEDAVMESMISPGEEREVVASLEPPCEDNEKIPVFNQSDNESVKLKEEINIFEQKYDDVHNEKADENDIFNPITVNPPSIDVLSEKELLVGDEKYFMDKEDISSPLQEKEHLEEVGKAVEDQVSDHDSSFEVIHDVPKEESSTDVQESCQEEKKLEEVAKDVISAVEVGDLPVIEQAEVEAAVIEQTEVGLPVTGQTDVEFSVIEQTEVEALVTEQTEMVAPVVKQTEVSAPVVDLEITESVGEQLSHIELSELEALEAFMSKPATETTINQVPSDVEIVEKESFISATEAAIEVIETFVEPTTEKPETLYIATESVEQVIESAVEATETHTGNEKAEIQVPSTAEEISSQFDELGKTVDGEVTPLCNGVHEKESVEETEVVKDVSQAAPEVTAAAVVGAVGVAAVTAAVKAAEKEVKSPNTKVGATAKPGAINGVPKRPLSAKAPLARPTSATSKTKPAPSAAAAATKKPAASQPINKPKAAPLSKPPVSKTTIPPIKQSAAKPASAATKLASKPATTAVKSDVTAKPSATKLSAATKPSAPATKTTAATKVAPKPKTTPTDNSVSKTNAVPKTKPLAPSPVTKTAAPLTKKPLPNAKPTSTVPRPPSAKSTVTKTTAQKAPIKSTITATKTVALKGKASVPAKKVETREPVTSTTNNHE